MEKNEQHIQNLLKSAKVKPSDNLQYRIMHQIQEEEKLKRVEVNTSSAYMMRIILGLIAIIYVLALIVGLAFYKESFTKYIDSNTLISASAFIILVCGAFGVITVFDESRRK